ECRRIFVGATFSVQVVEKEQPGDEIGAKLDEVLVRRRVNVRREAAAANGRQAAFGQIVGDEARTASPGNVVSGKALDRRMRPDGTHEQLLRVVAHHSSNRGGTRT